MTRKNKRELEFCEKVVIPELQKRNFFNGTFRRVTIEELNYCGIFFCNSNEEKVCYLSFGISWGDNGKKDKKTGERFESFTIRKEIAQSKGPYKRPEYENLMELKAKGDSRLNQILHIQVYTNDDEDGIFSMAISRTTDVLQMINNGYRSLFINPEDHHVFYSVSWKEMEEHSHEVTRA